MNLLKLSIGIDIGGTNTDIGLVSENGKIIDRQHLQTTQYFDAQLFVNDIMFAIRQIILENNVEQIVGIGIGAPCGNFY
jgi:glucokinase